LCLQPPRAFGHRIPHWLLPERGNIPLWRSLVINLVGRDLFEVISRRQGRALFERQRLWVGSCVSRAMRPLGYRTAEGLKLLGSV
jgi:hypothetical protein